MNPFTIGQIICIVMKNLLKVLVGAVVFLAYYFNFGKFFIMLKCYVAEKDYGIFPWMFDPIVSKSNPVWLMIHLASALLVVTLACRMIIWNERMRVFGLAHWIFTILVLFNITHFGQSDILTAIVLNGTPLLVANMAYCFMNKWSYAPLSYFLAVTSPILFEVFLYLKTFLPILIDIFFR